MIPMTSYLSGNTNKGCAFSLRLAMARLPLIPICVPASMPVLHVLLTLFAMRQRLR